MIVCEVLNIEMWRRAWKSLDEQPHDQPEPPHEPEAPLDSWRAWSSFAVIATANFGLNATFTVLSVMSPTLTVYFDTYESVVVWVTLGPMMLASVLAPSLGWLADEHGRKRMWLLGMAFNVGALVMSGTAPNIYVLIAGRALQGIGQAADGPAGTALIISRFSQSRRGRVIGITEGLNAVAPSVGIVVSGLLVDSVGWRLLFLGPIPLVAMAATAGAIFLREPPAESPRERRTFDWLGTAALFISMTLIIFAFDQAGRRGWTSPIVLASGVVGCAVLLVISPFPRADVAAGGRR